MKLDNDDINYIKKSIFDLLCQYESNLADHISKDKLDPKSIVALSKLLETYMKLFEAKKASNIGNPENSISIEDKQLLSLYQDLLAPCGSGCIEEV
ncbi:MAG: hypothetical protein AABY27_01945 [Pseudomonadota bacterium]